MDRQQKHLEPTRSQETTDAPARRADTAPAGQPVRRRNRRGWLIAAVLIVAGLIAWWHPWHRTSAPVETPAGRGGRHAMSNMPQPVHVAAVTQGQMPIVLNALGTVTPLANVTVRTQLSGTLQTVAFQEGQMVKKGDLLAQIDPRPYQI
jgi:multidrug efflux system membrane fusion protein